jgi:hypothetical protein
MSMPVRLTLITRHDCCLCDDMKAIVEGVVADSGAVLEIRDVDADAQLRARFSDEVPVLLINDRKAFKYRLSAAELRKKMSRAEGGSLWRNVLERLR